VRRARFAHLLRAGSPRMAHPCVLCKGGIPEREHPRDFVFDLAIPVSRHSNKVQKCPPASSATPATIISTISPVVAIIANLGWQARGGRDLFLQIFEETRQRYKFVVVSYVVMPDHIHLLISEPETGTPSTVMQVVKQRFPRTVLDALRNPTLAQNARWATRSTFGRSGFMTSMLERAQACGEASLHASQSGERGSGAGARTMAVEQLSQLRLRRAGRCEDQPVAKGGTSETSGSVALLLQAFSESHPGQSHRR
jgi:REP element-mobilizing transposase RayT